MAASQTVLQGLYLSVVLFHQQWQELLGTAVSNGPIAPAPDYRLFEALVE
jgi:hypothetical protein